MYPHFTTWPENSNFEEQLLGEKIANKASQEAGLAFVVTKPISAMSQTKPNNVQFAHE